MSLVKRLGTRFSVDATNRTPLPTAVVSRGTAFASQTTEKRDD
jgi:hypothetical protein